MARRFFVNENEILINGKNISVIGKEVHHINVLRHKVNDSILINNYVVKIQEINNEKLIGTIERIEETNDNNSATIKLYQSYIKSDKMELVVQKAVELGIKNIIPFLSKNSVVKLDNKDKLKKLERLNKISLEASKQCGRSDIVYIDSIFDISEENFIQDLMRNTFNVLAYENSDVSLKKTLRSMKLDNQENISVGVIIGPEGGFDKADLDILKNIPNLYEVSLGKNILRAETASINLLSILNYELND